MSKQKVRDLIKETSVKKHQLLVGMYIFKNNESNLTKEEEKVLEEAIKIFSKNLGITEKKLEFACRRYLK